MSYAPKYRLEFGDNEENPKKVEIWKRNYSGSVFPMIGTNDPVVVEWSGDNDFFKPIIGSRCTLNLYCTDETEYDDFYLFDENEYQIRVFSACSRAEIFEKRLDNVTGISVFESADCINGISDVIYKTNEIDFIERVVNDGGVVDKYDCVSKGITKTKSNFYRDIWRGFLVADNYKEVVTQKPFKIQLTGIDELGIMDKYQPNVQGREWDAMYNNIIQSGLSVVQVLLNSNRPKFVDYLTDTLLNNLKLFDKINVRGNLTTASQISHYIDDIDIHGDLVFEDDFEFLSLKDFITRISIYTNFKLYQQDGVLFYDDNWIHSNIIGEFRKQLSPDTSTTLQSLTPSQQVALSNQARDIQKSGGSSIEYYTQYQYNSTTNSSEIVNGKGRQSTVTIKRDLLPIGNDMTAEYLPPLLAYQGKVDLSREKFRNEILTFNPTVEFDKVHGGTSTSANPDLGIQLLAGGVSKQETPINNSGKSSLKITLFDSNLPASLLQPSFIVQGIQVDVGTTLQQFLFRKNWSGSKPNINIKFDYYCQQEFVQGVQNDQLQIRFAYAVEMRRSTNTNSANRLFYDADDNEFKLGSTVIKNEVSLRTPQDFNAWKSISQTGVQIEQGQGAVLLLDAKLTIYKPSNFGTGSGTSGNQADQFKGLYFDNLSVSVDSDGANKSFDFTINVKDSNNSKIKKEDIPQIQSYSEGDFTSDFKIQVDGQGGQTLTGRLSEKAKKVLKLQQTFVTRYELSVKNLKRIILNPSNRIYVNFDNLKDDSCCYIDGMKYDVKKNIYKLVLHKGTPLPTPEIQGNFKFK